MKKFVLVAIGAKFIHSSLALKYLSRFEDNDKHHDLTLAEFTINQRLDFILEELYQMRPDVLMISCYIWNIEMVKQLLPEIKKIMPTTVVALGGPEVSYDSERFLRQFAEVDLIMRGEGEIIFTALLDYFDGVGTALEEIKGLAYRDGAHIKKTVNQEPLDLARLPFPYEDDHLEEMEKIIYYESSRGCPYNCAYCLSSVEKGVRFVPLEKVYGDLQRFLDAGVRQVKFVDRTFNCNKAHTLALWRYLVEHDNGVTNFHFELTADLLDEELLTFLHPLRKGLFQFEIGVQSTNPETIKAIRRNVNFEKLSHIVHRVHQGGNIHQHLDLIAGLPYENYLSFRKSFNDVYALAPEQLQLGFLKVLSGTYLSEKAEEFGIVSKDYAPYEVLVTKELGFDEMLRLKYIAEMVEIYYNSGKFRFVIDELVSRWDDAFGFYEALGDYWRNHGLQYQNYSRIGLCDHLYAFVQKGAYCEEKRFKWLIKLDLCFHEKPKKLPKWMEEQSVDVYHDEKVRFYRNAQWVAQYLPQYVGTESKTLARMIHIEVFPNRTVLLFDYAARDMLGNGRCQNITEVFWEL